MNYIITGNRGLIGTYLKKRLDKEGHKCIMQIDKREGFDTTDLMFKDYELSEQVDIFFHFAAQCRINESIANPILPHKNNVDGILSVLEFCRKHKIPKIVVASSSRVLSPERNPYVASKIYTEELVKAYSDCYGIEYIIIRPSTVYGPMFDETSRCINNFLVNAFRGKDITIYGSPYKTLSFTYIDDFIDGIIESLKNKWNTEYNIAGKEEFLFDVAGLIISHFKTKLKLEFLPSEIAQPQNVELKSDYKCETKIEDGIKKMIKFYKDNPNAWKNYEDKGAKYYENNSTHLHKG